MGLSSGIPENGADAAHRIFGGREDAPTWVSRRSRLFGSTSVKRGHARES